MPTFISKPLVLKVRVKHITQNGGGCSNSPTNALPHGTGSITGKVLENGLPVSRRVMLYERKTGAYAGQARSGDDGVYTFKRTNEDMTYFIVSVDDNNDGVQYNLVGQDSISGNHDKRMAI